MPKLSQYKKHVTLIALVALFFSIFPPFTAKAAYRDTIEAEGTLLYYWPMDEDSGSTSLTALVGGVNINLSGATPGAAGQVNGTAVSFNGTSDFGVTASNLNLSSYNKVVVEALVNFDNYNAPNAMMSWELSASTNLRTDAFYFAAKNSIAPNDKFAPALLGNTGWNYAQYTHASAGSWHHVVAVYDKSASTNEVSLYVDGLLQTALTRPINSNNTNNFGDNVFYLMSRGGSSLFTPGKMQHLAIYSDLSSDRILAHAVASNLLEPAAGTLSKLENTSTTAMLSWTAMSYGVPPITTQLQHSPHGAGTWINVTGATTSPSRDSGLTPNTTYDYRVVYTDSSPGTFYSNTVTVTTSKIYPTYSANSDKVIVGPYDTAKSNATANWGVPPGMTSIDIMAKGQKYRIRQNGTIDRVRLYTVNKTNLTAVYIKIWRKNGTTYDLVGTSSNIVNDLTAASFSTIDLSTPITDVMEGDYVGIRIEANGTQNFYAYNPGNVVSYYVTNSTPSTTAMPWESQSSASSVMPIEVYMQAPQAAFIGDSIMAGYNSHYSFLNTTETTDVSSTIERQFSDLTAYTYQNMGIGGQTTAQIAARFTSDVINLHPRIAVIEGGVNDLAQSVPKATFLANWTSMLEAAQASGSITTIIILKILPWTNGTNTQMQDRDDWNSSLVTLAASYSKAIVVDADSYVGQFRAGGDPGNSWDIKTAYNDDNVHFKSAGHGQIAQALADGLPKPTAMFDNDFSAWNSGNVFVNYKLIQAGNATANISQTATSGIEYSTDSATWFDATDANGASEGLTNLAASGSPGTSHVFVWASATDLPNTKYATVYLRLRPNNGVVDASSWVTSNSFILDNVSEGVTVNQTGLTHTTEGGRETTLTIVLDNQPLYNVTLNLSSDDTTEGTVAPASLIFTPNNWNTPQNVTITGVNDDLDDDNVPYHISVTTTSSDLGYNNFNIPSVTIINDDDDVPPNVSVNPPSAVGTGATDISIGMGEAKNIGPVSSAGVNILGYVGSQGSFTVGGSDNSQHTITIVGLDLLYNIATIRLESDPRTIILKLAESTQVDLNNDSINDIEVKFVTVNVNRAELTITALPVSQLISPTSTRTQMFINIAERFHQEAMIITAQNNPSQYFTSSGTETTAKLGTSERAGAIYSYKEAFGAGPKTEPDWEDVLNIANGRWPLHINKAIEARSYINFRIIFGRKANMNDSNDVNFLKMAGYGVRGTSSRNLAAERKAITRFKTTFGFSPRTPYHWNIVRALAYSGLTK